ncbi:hypothetical protein HELRODRAFT_116477 [Helobdella robusta]|uniref:diacylglycerol cholinephosphotransferase n=1 Tax=Helobdella robusta TaxID=6412 RepID=T1EGF3_HELRO|nr:hypothetical protein HELRODRAFT_116477 [Helobdella robusta]ESN90929.1 hypothetical protein HELRODRAFT_116477 [Helobdella robusta]
MSTMPTKNRILSIQQLSKLKDHKYFSTGNTLLDPYMQIFWRWLVEQIPLTWAPNALTLAGLTGNILSTVFLMLYCPDGHGYAPPYCYLLCAFLLFIYQSLDAIDGKQARRTNSSTPLGELFDHGCDALSIVVIILGVAISSQIGSHPVIFSLVFFITTSLFYMAQWKTLVTGVMQFSLLDVTEGQVAIIALYLVNTFFGHSYWNANVIVEGLTPKLILWIVGILFGLSVFVKFMTVIVQEIKRKASDHGGINVYPAIPLLILITFGVVCCIFSKSRVMQNNLVLYHFMFGVVITKLCCRVLVSHMTKSEMCLVDSIFISPCLLFLVQMCQVASEDLMLWIAFIYAWMNLLVYVHQVCSDICDYLNIYCFSITHHNSNDVQPSKKS